MAKSQRVLQLIIGLGVGGAEVALLRSSRELKSRGHDLRVLSIKRLSSLESEFQRAGISVHYLGDLITSRSLLNDFREWRPNILLAWMPAAHLASVAVKKMVNAKHVIWNVRQTLNRREQIPFQTWMIIKTARRLSHIADAIIYNSERGAIDHQSEGYFADKQVVIPNGFAIPDHPSSANVLQKKQELGLNVDMPVITFVGRNHPDKGAQFFIEAASEYLKSNQAEFLIAGSGFEKMDGLSESAAQRFHFLGTLNEKNLSDVYSVTDIFTSSSISEGFSNAIGEAMSYANYPVVTNVGDSAKIVGEFGTVVDPENGAQICAAWSQFLKLPMERQAELRQCARQRVKSEYSLANVVKKYEDLFDAVSQS